MHGIMASELYHHTLDHWISNLLGSDIFHPLNNFPRRVEERYKYVTISATERYVPSHGVCLFILVFF